MVNYENKSDHDLLIEIHTILKNIVKEMDDHEKQDQESFKLIDLKFKESEKRVTLLERVYGIGAAFVISIDILYKWFKDKNG